MREPTAFEYFKRVLQKYAVFEGRARRKEFWYFILFTFLIHIPLLMLDMTFGWFDEEWGLGLLSGLFGLFLVIPSIAVTVRRLHDTGRAAWWIVLGFLPLLNLVLLVFMVLDSQPGENRYGPNPKAVPGWTA